MQIYTNVAGKPLDRPEYRPFWKKMNELGAPIWLHPARGAETPDYIDEKKSLYEIWWTFGWSYETACAMLRLVYSKIMDDHPNLKIITHHFGGIVPMLEGRLGPGNDVMGNRAPPTQDYVELAQEPEEAAARLFQEGFLGRHRGVYRGAGDQMRHGILPASTRSCSPPIARSIRKAAPCIRARRCGFSNSSICRRPTTTRSSTRTSKRSPGRSW